MRSPAARSTWFKAYEAAKKTRSWRGALSVHGRQMMRAAAATFAGTVVVALLQAAPAVRASRLRLAQATLKQLEQALEVLGITVPERM